MHSKSGSAVKQREALQNAALSPVSEQYGHILCEPIEENGKPGYRFTATGTFDGLLTGVKAVGNYGGEDS
jgi:hypothetical protein